LYTFIIALTTRTRCSSSLSTWTCDRTVTQ